MRGCKFALVVTEMARSLAAVERHYSQMIVETLFLYQASMDSNSLSLFLYFVDCGCLWLAPTRQFETRHSHRRRKHSTGRPLPPPSDWRKSNQVWEKCNCMKTGSVRLCDAGKPPSRLPSHRGYIDRYSVSPTLGSLYLYTSGVEAVNLVVPKVQRKAVTLCNPSI